MATFYFNADETDPEMCYPLSYWQNYAKEHETPVHLVEAVIVTGSDFFFCKAYFEAGLKSESECGKDCEGYEPRNGRNGRCKHSAHCYEQGEKRINLTPDPSPGERRETKAFYSVTNQN